MERRCSLGATGPWSSLRCLSTMIGRLNTVAPDGRGSEAKAAAASAGDNTIAVSFSHWLILACGEIVQTLILRAVRPLFFLLS